MDSNPWVKNEQRANMEKKSECPALTDTEAPESARMGGDAALRVQASQTFVINDSSSNSKLDH